MGATNTMGATASSSLGDVGNSAQGAAPQVSSMGASMDDAGNSAGGMRAELAEATDGISEVVIEVGEAIGAFAEFLVEVANVSNELKLMHDQLASAGGEQLVGVVDDLSKKLPESKAQIALMAEKLSAMGYSTDQVKTALQAASAANAQFAGSGDKLVAMMQKVASGGKITQKQLTTFLTGMKVTSGDVAKALGMTPAQVTQALAAGGEKAKAVMAKIGEIAGAKGAQALADKMDSIPTMLDKAKEFFFDLFSGIGDSPGYKEFISSIKAIAAAVESLVGGAKGGITNAFSAIFAVAAHVLIQIAILLLKVYTAGLRAYIWVLPFIAKLRQLWTEFGMTQKVITALKVVGIIIGGILLAAIAAVVSMWLTLNAVLVFFIDAGIRVWTIIVKIATYIYQLATAVWGFISGAAKAFTGWIDDAVNAGENFVKGLADGIKNGAKWVLDAIANLGNAAVSKFKEVLHIGSPSKVMMQMGKFTGQGVAEGIKSSQDEVQQAASGLGGAAVAGVGGAGSGGSNSVSVSFGAGAIQVSGGQGELTQDLVEEALFLALERAGLTQGVITPEQGATT